MAAAKRKAVRAAVAAALAFVATLGAGAAAEAAPVQPFIVGGEEADIEDYPFTGG
ncbi:MULTISPECIES: hypothetical protein [Thermocrispum]|jgi:hypothetical protein|uniref:Uncharacterized protein n=1 Tax=Thermocrispum agreste TaxID=37925 RepID=A0ABD6FFT2_9PSEU|nr:MULTISPECIES: hypothetical protein [Thermocrispum]